ncbi:tripartite tricarboxylate transporter substrate binding protein [Alteromonas confluentis]|uniref:Transporter n=1 Tax=Alteromonas confluentis TaxID=1656094 RepID=A0A1E7ZA10_9ALTE|nr:tripartite tricarboxylate transporter substrate-binding protein [Alteromonas confluentis]OFC70291.1 transporter [Alteromonas confluentis]
MAKDHFLIPGGPGGGWDTTARGIGEALMKSGLSDNASFQNMSGGGGGRAIAYLIEIGDRQGDMLMVNSTPIVIRALTGQVPYSYRDVKPIASIIADYGAFIVRADSPLKTWDDAVTELRKNVRSLTIAGGSARGSMDHLVAALAVNAAGLEGSRIRYIPYDAGGQAKAGLLSGEVQMLSTGLSEALEIAESGQARILAITAPETIPAYPELPTLKSLGYDTSFVNWRGLFAYPDVPDEKVQEYIELYSKLLKTPEWAAVRDRNGWMDLFRTTDDFEADLQAQEEQLRELMTELGFIQ